MNDTKIQALVDKTGKVLATALLGAQKLPDGRTVTAGILVEKDQKLYELDAHHIADYQKLDAEDVHRRVSDAIKSKIARPVHN